MKENTTNQLEVYYSTPIYVCCTSLNLELHNFLHKMKYLSCIFKFIFIATLFLPQSTSSSPQGFRLELEHVDSNSNLTKFELIQRSFHRSHKRMARLTGTTSDIRSSIHVGNGEFLMDLSIGTPPIPLSAIVDTGSDLIWTQCKPCIQCFNQPTPLFDPKNSSTYTTTTCSSNLCEALPTSKCNNDNTCKYLYTYGDSSSTKGVLASETFTLGSTSVPHIAFGCGNTNLGDGFSQGSGLVGLGRGPLSLISQLKLGKFSYCLMSLDDTSKKSPLLFGSLAKLDASTAVTTPLVVNPSQPSFYYLTLKGITVGKEKLKIPSTVFEVEEDGSGGLIIDSGTSITYFDVRAYRLVKKAFVEQVNMEVGDGSDVGLDLCFAVPSGGSGVQDVVVPKLILHFDRGDLDLPGENYMVLDSQSGLLCLTVMGSSGMSILGNFQQQNLHVLYDLEKGSLSFMPAKCDEL